MFGLLGCYATFISTRVIGLILVPDLLCRSVGTYNPFDDSLFPSFPSTVEVRTTDKAAGKPDICLRAS